MAKVSNLVLATLDTIHGMLNRCDVQALHIYNDFGTFELLSEGKKITVNVHIEDVKTEGEKKDA